MTEQEIKDMLIDSGALFEGHFQLSSGLHADKYIQCARVLQHPARAEELGRAAAADWQKEEIDAVIGPALGGVVFSYVTAAALGVRSLFSERKDGEMQLRRGFEFQPGERILVVEDVVTTGGSVQEVLDLLQNYEVEVVGITAIVDRSGGRVDFPCIFKSLLELEIEAVNREDCPQCHQGREITRPGSKSTPEQSS